MPGDGRADDRQQRVENQHDDRDPRAQPADERQRQQEPEHRQARNRLDDVGQPHDRRAERAAAAPRGSRSARRSRSRRAVETPTRTTCCAEQRNELRRVRAPEIEQAHCADPAAAPRLEAAAPAAAARADRSTARARRGVSSCASTPSASTPTRGGQRERLAPCRASRCTTVLRTCAWMRRNSRAARRASPDRARRTARPSAGSADRRPARAPRRRAAAVRPRARRASGRA